MFKFFFPIQSSVSCLAPYFEAEPTPSTLVSAEGPPIKVTDVVRGVRGLNEGISRDSLQLKEVFSREVSGNSVTPSCFHLLQWFFLFHWFIVWPDGKQNHMKRY